MKFDVKKLRKWYVQEKRSYRYIMKELGINNARIMKDALIKAGIKIRDKSAAVATQWIANDKRRNKTSKLAKKNLKPHWGKHWTEERKRKISESHAGDKNPMYGRTGEKSPLWLGGKNNWMRGRKINQKKRAALLKDLGNKCNKCGTSDDLTLNHIIPWRESRSHDISNLEILCKKCHFSMPHSVR
jgi:hypothetical protein